MDQLLENKISKLQIIQVPTPKFEHDGKDMYVDSKMYRNLGQFQNDIYEYEKKGATKCFFIHYIHNMMN